MIRLPLPVTRRARLAAWLAVILAGAPVAHAQVSLSFAPLHSTFCDTATVDVTVDGAAADLRGFSLVFEFDPTIVQPISVARGALMTGAPCGSFLSWLNIAAVGDSIAVDGATLGCSMTGPGSILRFRFVPGAFTGTSPLRCRHGLLRDSLNQPVAFTSVAGSLMHPCVPIEVAPHTWSRVKTHFR